MVDWRRGGGGRGVGGVCTACELWELGGTAICCLYAEVYYEYEVNYDNRFSAVRRAEALFVTWCTLVMPHPPFTFMPALRTGRGETTSAHT